MRGGPGVVETREGSGSSPGPGVMSGVGGVNNGVSQSALPYQILLLLQGNPASSLAFKVCGLEALETLEASLLINHMAGCSRDASGSRWKHGTYR